MNVVRTVKNSNSLVRGFLRRVCPELIRATTTKILAGGLSLHDHSIWQHTKEPCTPHWTALPPVSSTGGKTRVAPKNLRLNNSHAPRQLLQCPGALASAARRAADSAAAAEAEAPSAKEAAAQFTATWQIPGGQEVFLRSGPPLLPSTKSMRSANICLDLNDFCEGTNLPNQME